MWYGREEEEVPGEEGEDGGEDGRPGAGGARDEQDDEQIEQRPLALGELAAAGEEQRGAQGDRPEGEEIPVTRECLRDPSDDVILAEAGPGRLYRRAAGLSRALAVAPRPAVCVATPQGDDRWGRQFWTSGG